MAGTPPFSLSFPLADVAVEVNEAGSLAHLQVSRRNQDHPSPPSTPPSGVYWSLAPDGADYVLRATFPHAGLDNPAACRLTGTTWDCGREAFTASRVTRAG